jgi:hypothetical protein
MSTPSPSDHDVDASSPDASDDAAVERATAIHSLDDELRVRSGGDETGPVDKSRMSGAGHDVLEERRDSAPESSAPESPHEQLRRDPRRRRAEDPAASGPEDELPTAAPPTGDANR